MEAEIRWKLLLDIDLVQNPVPIGKHHNLIIPEEIIFLISESEKTVDSSNFQILKQLHDYRVIEIE